MPVVDPAAAGSLALPLVLVIALPAVRRRRAAARRSPHRPRRVTCSAARRCSARSCCSLFLFFAILGRDAADRQISLTSGRGSAPATGTVELGLLYDPLSALFLLLITGVGGLIHIYSIGYMEHDERRRRFFGYLNLFVAAMLVLVLASDYVGVFLGWEGVGLASYLLIGFWQYKPSAAAAAKKAFVINRVGDIGLSLGIGLIFVTFGTTSFDKVSELTCGRLAGRDDRDRPAPAAGRVRQVRAVPAADLAARRDGGPDPGLGADPRGDDGDRGRLPDRPLAVHLRVHRRRPPRRRGRRHHHAADGCLDRVRQGRHQEGAGRLDDEPDRLHDPGRRARRGRLRVRDLPPADPRLLQGQHVPRRRLGDARHQRRRGHAPLRRAAQADAGHLPDLRDGLPRDHRVPRLLRLLVEGQDHRDRAGAEPLARHLRADRCRRHRLLHDPADADDLLHQGALGGGRAPARVAEGDDRSPDRAGRAVGPRWAAAAQRLDRRRSSRR